jgi:hypothetical protein
VLKELSALKGQAISNIQTNFDSELIVSTSSCLKIEAEYKRLYSDSTIKLVGPTLRYDNKSDKTKALTAFLPFQWFLRIHQCKELIEALHEYAPHVEALKDAVNDDDLMRELPKVDWESSIDPTKATAINSFIDDNFDDEGDRSLFKTFLDGRSWLDLKTLAGVETNELTGKKLNRTSKDYIGSVITTVTRLINDTAGALPQFINLYLSSEEVRNILSELPMKHSSEEPVFLKGGTNVIYYGAPGTGKSHTIDSVIDEDYTIRTVFHADTQNSDFVGCLKPKMKGDTIHYEFRSGPFTNAIIHAYQNPSLHNYLVIEELNRAPAAAVFGEIFQLLDRKPTGESSYSINVSDIDMINHIELETGITLNKGMLKIPSNLSFLATMNSSDQAVMPLDTAFKRRWNFRYIPLDFDNSYTDDGKPCSDGVLLIQEHSLEENITKQVEWKDFALAVNTVLTENSVPEDKHLGPFFLSDNELIAEKREESLTGKLFMYLWDDVLRHGMKELIFNTDIKTYGQLIRSHEENQPIFSEHFYELLSDKLQPCPEE